MKIVIGHNSDHKPVKIDVSELTNSNLLIEGATGSGKSYAARKVLEELLALGVQCIIIDPDGELVTLREKFNLVYAGANGEAPMSLHTATMLAEKILEHQFSCICDLSEVKKVERPRWVKVFLESLMDSPKKYWHQVKVVFIDEVHLFCPEKDPRESTAAVSDLAGRGLKRGLVTIAATQRISKFNKDAASELQNILVGRHFMDIDRQRAAETLGVTKQSMPEFMAKIKVLPRGDFFAIGAAISEECIQLHVDQVKTTHPERGSKRKAVSIPPAPAAIKGVLEAIRDLPAQVEKKLKTEADFKGEIRRLEGELRTAHSQRAAASPVVGKQSVVVDTKAVDRAVQKAVKAANEYWGREWDKFYRMAKKLKEALAQASSVHDEVDEEFPVRRPDGPEFNQAIGLPIEVTAPVREQPQVVYQGSRKPTVVATLDGLSGPEQRILNAIAWLNSIGVEDPEQTAVAFLAGYTIGGGGYCNPRGALNTKGMLQYVPGDKIRLTEAGRAAAQAPDRALDTKELQRMVMSRLPGPESKILKVLIDSYPRSLTNDECAEQAGYSADGGGYCNPRGRLRTLGLIEYPESGKVVARSILFLD